MSENIHLLESDIHSNFNTGFFATGGYEAQLISIASGYGIRDASNTNSQSQHAFAKAIRELNRKLSQFNLSSNIVETTNAGLQPTQDGLDNFFGNVATPTLPDFVELENDSFLLQENGFKIVTEVNN